MYASTLFQSEEAVGDPILRVFITEKVRSITSKLM